MSITIAILDGDDELTRSLDLTDGRLNRLRERLDVQDRMLTEQRAAIERLTTLVSAQAQTLNLAAQAIAVVQADALEAVRILAARITELNGHVARHEALLNPSWPDVPAA